MLDLRTVTEQLDEVRAGLARRGWQDDHVLEELAALAAERRRVLAEAEALRARRNEVSAALASADKKSADFARSRDEMKQVGERVKALDAAHAEVEGRLEALLLGLPNLPHPEAPDGAGEADNVVVRTWGERPAFEFPPRDHVDLGAALGILDFERAAKLSGARFVVLRGAGARLERALLSFMLDVHADGHGYEEIWPPALVRDDALRGTGQLPKFAEDLFRIARDWDTAGETEGHDLYLIPTAEVPVTNLHAGEILDGPSLPRTYCAYTPCFRSEAGSHGRDTRGMIRQHQFDKVELVRIERAEDARAALETLTAHAETILQRLGLHYRVVALCASDLGFGSQLTYDLEVWLPSQGTYREISSCSWFGDFQARRADIRYRPAPKEKPRFAHTLNGSALAIGRTLVALLEQGQRADGSVRLPPVLAPYLGGLEVLEPR